jgi:hypothetical protein
VYQAISASLLGGVAADQFAQRFGQSRALFVAILLLLCLPFIVAFRVSSTDSSLFMVGMVVSVFAFSFPYGAMVASLVAEAPQALKALVMDAALFCANVGVIGVGAFLLGPSADWMAAAEVAAPMTRALLGADLLVLPAILVYLALHRSVTVEGAE